MEVVKFIGQNVGFRNEVERLSAKPFLHLHIVVAETVLAGNFMALWEVVDSLELIEALIEIALARAS